MNHRSADLELERPAGKVVLEIVHEEERPPHVEFRAVNPDGSTRQSLGIRREELGRVIETLQQYDRVLNGHPKHRAKAPVG